MIVRAVPRLAAAVRRDFISIFSTADKSALLILAMVMGALVSLLLPQSPPPWVNGLLVLCALPALLHRAGRLPAAALLSLSWCLYQFDARLQERLHPVFAGQEYVLTGSIESLPVVQEGLTRFRFSPGPTGIAANLPGSVLVSWYRDAPEVHAGETWRLRLLMKPPWGAVNFSGSDRERWLFANGYGATATVKEGVKLAAPFGISGIQPLRERIRQEIDKRVAGEHTRGVIRALAIADTSGLHSSVRDSLRATGTSHLLAISGLHIGLAAAGGYWLFRLLTGFVRVGRFAFFLSAAGAGLVAAAYAALANLGVSTSRALIMLLVFSTSMVCARHVNAARSFMLAAAVVLLTDPFAALGSGFWFSFLAVAALLLTFRPRTGRLHRAGAVLLAQGAVLLALLPVSAAWYSGFSPLGFPANIIAIPWVSLFIVPPVLGGIAFLPFFPEISSLLWGVGGNAVDWLLWFLGALTSLADGLAGLAGVSLFHQVLAFGGAMLLFLPRILRWKWLGLFLLLPLFMPAATKPASGSAVIEVLDAGQGTAVTVSTAEHLLLYDTGPGDGGEINVVDSAIHPAIRRSGHSDPDLIVVSHGDLDHAGGLQELRSRFPASDLRVNRPDDPAYPCIFGWRWHWDGFDFRALHPSPGLPYMGNDSSCVLGMRGAGGSLLLAGDISSPIESRLAVLADLQHAVLLVPHHGSKSSSDPVFIDSVQPELAVATAALGNRFGFPTEEVRKRFRQAGVPLISTGACGAVQILLAGGKIQSVKSARKERKRIWRWPAVRNSP